MTSQEILDFLNAHPVVYLATVEGNAPRVRGMMLARADAQGILFHTGKNKDMTHQMEQNPVAEICVFDPESNVQVRVHGQVEFIDDLELKKALVAERPFLQPMVEKTGYADFVLFRMTGCQAHVWTMATNLQPQSWTPLC